MEREEADKVLYATASLGFGLYMLDHAEDGWYSQEPEFALPFSEFPLAIREVTEIVEAFIAETESVKARCGLGSISRHPNGSWTTL